MRSSFGSKFGFFAAAVGSAVGLGNIWRFPYLTGNNGGAAFILVYLCCVLIIGLPILISELVIGRRGQGNSFRSFKNLTPKQHWSFVGILGVLAAFIILSFYGTVAGWTLEYCFISVKSMVSQSQTTNYADTFSAFTASATVPVICQLIFMMLTAVIILFGVQKGIEKSSKIMLPLLFVILIILCIKVLTLPNSFGGIKFLFKPDFSKINSSVFLSALGQAFFSLSVGMGALITYGSYVDKKVNMQKTAFYIVITDLAVAILAGIAIFPALFSFGMSPKEGPGLVFVILPEIFAQMSGGAFFALIFFVLLAVAALTSSISLLEVVVLFFTEEFKLKRWLATFLATVGASILGVFTTISFGPFKDTTIFGKTFFDAADFFASNILLPLGGLFIVIFIGWFYNQKFIKKELTNDGTIKFKLFKAYYFIIKYIAPIAIILVFFKGLGII
jgi:NSS family neurotransmitter:Na+ symporter